MNTYATPAKLKDGTWGVRVRGIPRPGQIVEVRTAAGKMWDVRVVEVLSSTNGPDGTSLCASESMDRSARPARPARIHPDALTRRGNNGFGPDDCAYDDI